MKVKFLIVGLLAGVFALAPVFSGNVQAEEKAAAAPDKKVKKAVKKAVVTDKASEKAKTRGEAVSNKALLNDPAKTVSAPPAKGGGKTRGAASCDITVDNWTGLKAVIFVDGEEIGLVSAWGKASGYLAKGDHTIKGVAYFTDGSEQYWGPRDFTCNGEFTWKISY